MIMHDLLTQPHITLPQLCLYSNASALAHCDEITKGVYGQETAYISQDHYRMPQSL